MAVRGRPATRPHRRTGSLPYVRDPGGRYLPPRSAAAATAIRHLTSTPAGSNAGARGVAGGHGVHKCTGSSGALKQLLDAPERCDLPALLCASGLQNTRALASPRPPPAASRVPCAWKNADDGQPASHGGRALRQEVGADRELSKSDGRIHVARETVQVALLESDPADHVGEGHGLLRQPRKHRQRPELDILPEVVQGFAQPRTRNRLQLSQQQRKLPDNVLLSQ